ncbi:MAG: hypothetical protein ACP6IQ_02590 [Candidatus Njordarchaeia archaeon]
MKKVYLVTYTDIEECSVDSIWNDKKLANRRLKNIKEQIKRLIDKEDKEYKSVYECELERWGIEEFEVNCVYKEKIYE